MASRNALRRQQSFRSGSYRQSAIVEALEDRTLLSVVTFAVNSGDDSVDANPGDGIAADSLGRTTLRAAIMEANALNNADGAQINLPVGLYGLTLAGIGENNAATGDLDVKSKISITGANATTTAINANSLDRVFHVLPGASLSLQKVRVSGGSTTDADPLGGGGIASDHATLTIEDSIISGNTAAGHTDDYGGGGIMVYGGSAVIRRSFIRENSLTKNAATEGSSSRFGAGLYAQEANVDIFNTAINANTGHEGAGLANIGGGTMRLAFVNVFGNTSDYEGGGIQNELSTLIINSSRIAENTSVDLGGGLYNFAGNVTMNGVEFVGNSTDGDGGGIWNSGRVTAAIGTILIKNSTIRDNSAELGGGIGNTRDSFLTIRDTMISGNTATNGAGIANHNESSFGPGTVWLLRTTVTGNTATQAGGGVLALKNKTNIVDSTITENHAQFGGGLANLDGGVMRLSEVTVARNTASKEGGGMTNELATLILMYAHVDHNTSGGDGGGLFNFAGTVSMTNSDFTTNSAVSEGGGVENTGRVTAAIGKMEIIRTVFSGNSADFGGGIDNKRDSLMTIRDSLINDNHATTAGGGIANQNTEAFGPGVLSIRRSQIVGNSSDEYGGGIFAIKNATNIVDSSVRENTAHQGGGLANLDDGVMRLGNVTVSNNSATHEGGGITNEMARLELNTVNAVGNYSGGDGGGLYSFAGDVTINAGSFRDNTAVSEGGGIENTGRVTARIGKMRINRVEISGNTAAIGGGVDNKRDSQMVIESSYIHNNHATQNGGGLANQSSEAFDPGQMVVNRSTIAYNTTDGNGGGIFTLRNKTYLRNVTVTENSAVGSGGGLANDGTGRYSVVNATIARNSANNAGGIYNNAAGTFGIANSIVALNTATTSNPDAAGTFSFSTYNLIGVVGSAVGFVNGVDGNIVGTSGSPIDPLLGTLQNNGGPTPTLAVLAGSQAIDAGSNAIAAIVGLTTDQRGKPRVKDGDGNGSVIVDMGAFEVQPTVALDLVFSGTNLL